MNKQVLKNNKQNDEIEENSITRNEIIYEFKKKISNKTLYKKMPTKFEIILNYAKNLRFKEEPNYA